MRGNDSGIPARGLIFDEGETPVARSIDFGIDLGTTNSAIARQSGVTTQVIEADGEPLVPSIVHLAGDGSTLVGADAVEARRSEPGNSAAEFKRLMGTGENFIAANGRTLSPEELSAAVLRKLLARAEAESGAPVTAAVITIPAMFQLPQCEATRRAAKLAGLEQSPLLQEPIAAAIASIGSAELRDGYWLIYDLGGGTFDVSLVRSRGGRLQVLDHDGDNHLGGRDLDRLLARNLTEMIRADGRLGGFGRGEPAFTALAPVIRVEAERVRIALSDRDSDVARIAYGEGSVRHDFAFPIARAELEAMIEPILARTVKLCLEVLGRNRLEPAALARLVLVGGPTRTPYLKAYLAAQLGIEVRHYVDPTKAVVIGAAIYASTQRLPSRPVPEGSTRLAVELAYEAMTTNPRPVVVGKLMGPRAAGLWRIRARDAEGRFDATPAEVRGDGGFAIPLQLAENRLNAFTLTVEHDGAAVAIDDPGFVIVHGTTVAKPVLSRSVGVMLADNSVRWYLRKGSVLPARQVASHSTTVALKRGQSGTAIHVPLIQGESDQADRNTVIGELRISAADLPNDLPVGSEVIVTMSIDEHSESKAQAYIPALDQTFGEVVQFGLEARGEAELRVDADAQQARLRELLGLAESIENEPGGNGALNADLQAIDELLEDGGADERIQVGEMLRNLTGMIDKMEADTTGADLSDRFQASYRQCWALFPEQGDEQLKRESNAIYDEFFEAIARSDFDIAKARFDAIETIEWRLIQREPQYWRDLFESLSNQALNGPNAAEARIAIDAGKSAAMQDNLADLVDACMELIRLLPERTNLPAAVLSHVA